MSVFGEKKCDWKWKGHEFEKIFALSLFNVPALASLLSLTGDASRKGHLTGTDKTQRRLEDMRMGNQCS